MNKLILCCLSVWWISVTYTVLPPTNKPIKIDSPVINLVNGTAFIDIEGIINLRLKVRGLNLGEPTKLCLYQGALYSVRELGQKEDAADADTAALKNTLDAAINLFEKISEPYLKDAQAGKHFSMKIIGRWLEQRGRPTSHLGEWAKNTVADERILFRKEMISFKKLDQFCDDLALFLLDLVYSCDKSYQNYREKKAAAHAAGKKTEHNEHNEYHEQHDGIDCTID